MKAINLAMIGSGGYAEVYFENLKKLNPKSFHLVGVVDPFADQTSIYPTLAEKGIATFDTIEELYSEKKVDAVCIVSPPAFHKHQCEYAITHGSKVLCEKPLTPLLQDTVDLVALQEEYQGQIGVGFQWCYSDAMLALKKDILDGAFGSPQLLKVLVSWPRGNDYYSSSWHGKLHGRDGSIVLDSVLSNATAHFLFNILYILGSKITTAANPKWLKTGLYRAKEIESFDTCTIRGGLESGAEFLYLATHAGTADINPTICYQFEKASIMFDGDYLEGSLLAKYNDGRVKNYGCLLDSEKKKLELFIQHADSDSFLPCDAQTIVPQIKTVNFVFEKFPIRSFPSGTVSYDAKFGKVAEEINDVLLKCFREGKTPEEMNVSWAEEKKEFIGNYSKFTSIFS